MPLKAFEIHYLKKATAFVGETTVVYQVKAGDQTEARKKMFDELGKVQILRIYEC